MHSVFCFISVYINPCSYKYCFEVATAKRPYLLCAEKDFELQQWVAAFQKVS